MTTLTLAELRRDDSKTLNPADFASETFALYSIPSHATGAPETVAGKKIGSTKRTVIPRTVLLSKINPRISRVWVVTSGGPFRPIASPEWLQFEPSDRVVPEYLAWFLRQNTIRDHFAANVSGVGGSLTRLNAKALEDISLQLPAITRQKEIVAYLDEQLSHLDASVAALHRVQANLKRYRASVLKAACEGRLVPTEAELARQEGRDFETGARLLQRVAEKQPARAARRNEHLVDDAVSLSSLPTGWTWATMGQIGIVVSGLTKNPKREGLELKLPYLRVANVYADELRLSEIETIGVGDTELEKLLVLKDDLLVVEGNGSPDQIGRVALWDGSISPCVHQNHLIKVRLSVVNARWVMNWLLSPEGRKQIEQVSSSTSGLHTLSTGKVARLTVPLPPLAEQQRIVAEADRRLSLIRVAEAQVTANLARAQRLRQSILQAAFATPASAGQ